jgi:hypothetical protein
VMPLAGTEVAMMTPDPAAERLEPVPTTMVAEAFVPPVRVLKAALPAVPPEVPHENPCVAVL